MKFFTTILLFIALFVSLLSRAQAQLNINSTYKITHGSIETTSNETIPVNTLIQIESLSGWSVNFRELGQDLEPIGPLRTGSRVWVERAVAPVEVNDIINNIVNINDYAQTAELTSCAPLTSLRPRANPRRQQTPLSSSANQSLLTKDQTGVDRYFACYQKSSSLQSDYQNSYRQSLQKISTEFHRLQNNDLSLESVNTLMSCLIFRESALWEGGTSHSGAVGLGQFTSIAIDQVKDFIDFSGRDNFDERERVQMAENEAGRLNQSELAQNLGLIAIERRNYERYAKVRDYWNALPINPKPDSSEINSQYLANNNNHEAVMALSSLILLNCQIQLEQSEALLSPDQRLLACAGAYNMGVGGFSRNALGRNEEQGLSAWIENLRNSGDSQSNETINHLVSVNRCQTNESNYPPCGTQADYCQDLPRANSCQDQVRPQCVGECQ